MLAGRLARATPRLQIVVLEAGADNHNDPMVVRPGNYLAALASANRLRPYEAEASPHVSGRSVVIPAGNGLGGGSSVNFMMYGPPQQKGGEHGESNCEGAQREKPIARAHSGSMER